NGIGEMIKKKAARGCSVVGICGGYQMLGRKVVDTLGVENKTVLMGLGLLDIESCFQKEKITVQVEGKSVSGGFPVKGYEIHHGHTRRLKGCIPVFVLNKRNGKKTSVKDGVCNSLGNVWGTYVHGVFDCFDFRRNFLDRLRKKKGLPASSGKDTFFQDEEYDKLASLLRKNLNIKLLSGIIHGER
ncbi:MAG: cobyric acid synthase CobQ, partial [Candidatus Omnitrophica bacterium]|nr:cobyric acid synthase CobQ [Candidatus Omnitrophota bacterium]